MDLPAFSKSTDSRSDPLPEMAPINQATRLAGLSRSSIYREATAGNIRLVKYRRSTLVDMASLRQFLASLPTATLRAPRAA
jgi:hypothetical protein